MTAILLFAGVISFLKVFLEAFPKWFSLRNRWSRRRSSYIGRLPATRSAIFGKLANTTSPTTFMLGAETLSSVSLALCH
jgi:hypothetical protein